MVLCGRDQTFFCKNFTHYIPCTRIDNTKLSALHKTNNKAYDCGPGRCCRPGAPAPCSYECAFRSLDFENPRFRWIGLNQEVHKQIIELTEPLSSEEVDSQNKIVSIKNFIVRQKNVKDETSNWKPSYRMFCNVQLCSLQGNCGTKSTIASISSTIKTTTTPITTQKTTTTTRRTTQKTTTRTIKTTRKTTTKKTTTRRTTTTTRTTQKATTIDIYACTAKLKHQKKPVETSCQDYLECVPVGKNLYRWKFFSCKKNHLFDKNYQTCRHNKWVKCVDNKSKLKKGWRSFLE